MKIIFVTREGYNLAGARIRCYNFSRALSASGMDSEVLSFSDSLGAEDGEKESQMGLREKIGYNWKALRRLAKEKEAVFYIQRFNYHAFAPYLAHILNKNKVVFDMDDWEMREDPRYYLGFFPTSRAHYMTAKIARDSVLCIAASRFLADFLSQFNRRVYYIPSGVDTDLFRPDLKCADGREVVFSWIGTFNKEEYVENIKFALECFCILRNKYPHIYFDVVGGGIFRKDLAQEIKKYHDSNIRLKEWIFVDKIPDYLNTVHIGLMPVVNKTKFNMAKSPTKLFEYMAMAKPTVSSRLGEAQNIIRDAENGFLAETKEEFILKMQNLIEDAGLRQRLGREARKTAEEDYSLNVLCAKLSGILNSA